MGYFKSTANKVNNKTNSSKVGGAVRIIEVERVQSAMNRMKIHS